MFCAFLYFLVCKSTSQKLHEQIPSIYPPISNQKLEYESPALLSKCPPRPSGSFVKTIIEGEIMSYSNSIVYGCDVHLTRQIKLDKCVLLVYNSLFERSTTSSIYLSLTATAIYNSNLKKSIEIIGCNFSNSISNNGAALFVNCTEVSKSITVSGCQFDGLTADQGGAIFYLYTYDSSISSIDQIKEEHALLIENSSFNNTKSQKIGGSVCVLAPKGQSNRPIEIKNCTFSFCENVGASESANGGALYFSSSEVLRRFNVLHSTFYSCHSNSFGGAIYFNSILGNIRDCNFTNNSAEKEGSDIYYETGSSVKTTEKLAIFKSFFNHDEQLSSQKKSLVYLVLSDISIFDFDSNQIHINKNGFYVFNTQSFKGTLTITNNCLSPPDDSLYESGKVLSSKINFYSAFSKLCTEQECPSKPDDSLEIGQSGCDKTNKVLYACNQRFETNEIKATNSVLDVFNCTFSKTNEGHFPILIIINNNIQSEMIGPTKIRSCFFNECGSEAIHIESSVVNYGFDIVGCSFTFNKNGAIYIRTILGLIQKCYFLDNSINRMHRDIQYECGLDDSSIENGQKLTIFDNTFNLTFKDGIGQNQGSFIFINFNSKTIFDFNNNKIIIDGSLDSAENLFVFDCPVSSSLKGTWSIYDNCLSPPNDRFIKSGNIPDDFIKDLDSAFKDTCLTNDCPTMIEGSTVLWDGNYKETDIFENENVYACGQYLDTHIQLNRCILKIYYCVFSSCRPESATKGGAIFINIESSMSQESNEAIEIFNCQFNICEEDAGGAVYIRSSDPSRKFDIRDCVFDHNKAISSGKAPGSGGSIYVNATLVNIERCVFSSNTAKNGASVYILGYVPNAAAQSIVIKSCSFDRNEAEIDGGDIYYEYSSSRESLSKLLDDDKVALSITNCTMYKCSSAQSGASLALKLCSEKSDNIVINNCTFTECLSLKYGGAIYLESDNYASLFNISNCLFKSSEGNYASAIYFMCCNCMISNCQFIDLLGSGDSSCVLYYNNNNYGFGSSAGEITVERCIFEQTEKVKSIFGYTSRENSVVNFNNNNVHIYNNETVVFSTYYSTQGRWNFDGNYIIPPYDSYIKASRTILNVACGKGFICLLPTGSPTQSGMYGTCNEGERCIYKGDESDPDIVVIKSSSFNDYKCTDNGAVVHLKNCGLKCDDSKFTNCLANSGGGGAIYIYINEAVAAPVELNCVTFTSCQAAYGGASYIYSSIESINVIINNCIFVKNKANSGSGYNGLTGGNSLYLTIQQGSINNCNFNQNAGLSSVKVTNKFDGLLDESSFHSSISFDNCVFEINNNSSSSLLYDKKTNSDFIVSIKNCIFSGDLYNNHHIETKDFTQSSYSSKFVVENCKFSSDKKEAIKNDSNVYIMNIDSQEFNYFKKNNKSSSSYMKLKVGFAVLLINIIIVVVFILYIQNKKIAFWQYKTKEENPINR